MRDHIDIANLFGSGSQSKHLKKTRPIHIEPPNKLPNTMAGSRGDLHGQLQSKSPWVLLHGAGDGNLAMLVSALAQPLRPWALGGALGAAGSGPAEEFLPGQLLLRRASGAWVERLREGPGALELCELVGNRWKSGAI